MFQCWESTNRRGHPLREDVSWNVVPSGMKELIPEVILFVRMWVEMTLCHLRTGKKHRHPLREDVSWNNFDTMVDGPRILSSSSWGCELKYDIRGEFLGIPNVILFVRMWVEISQALECLLDSSSSSSWGCELKYFYIPKRNDRLQVILFVRMWVEIVNRSSLMTNGWASSSSWGCELKCCSFWCRIHRIWSSSSWGCELKW